MSEESELPDYRHTVDDYYIRINAELWSVYNRFRHEFAPDEQMEKWALKQFKRELKEDWEMCYMEEIYLDPDDDDMRFV